MMPDSFVLRPAAAGDEDFLFELYASTRQDEMACWGWDAATSQSFLRSQFAAHQSFYQSQGASVQRWVIERGGLACGCLILLQGVPEWRLADIAVLPRHRGQGIGGRAIQRVLDEAHAAGAGVSLQVWKGNPALRLYRRLGFREAGSSDTHLLLRRDAPASGEPES